MPKAIYGDWFYDDAPYVLILLMLVCRTDAFIARCSCTATAGKTQVPSQQCLLVSRASIPSGLQSEGQ